MPTTTTNYGFTKPDDGQATLWGDQVNVNFDSIDSLIFASEKLANKGQANGYAALDSGGQVPTGQIPAIPESGVTNLVSDLAAKAPLASPAFTGTPTAPTPLTADNTTKLATTAFVKAQGYITSAPVTTVAGRTGDVVIAESDVTNLVSDLAAKAPLASPTFTGTPAAPTPSTADNSTKIATTAYVQAQGYITSAPVTTVAGRTGDVTLAESDISGLVSDLAAKAPLASPTFTGTPTAPTPSTPDNSTKLATTAYVQAQGYLTSAPVTSVAGRTGAVTLAESDISGLVSDLAAKAPTSRAINTTAPLTGGGDLSADRTLAISNFTGDAGSGGSKGAVPAPVTGDAAKFLKGSGAWAAIAESDVTSLTSDLALKAPLASPTFTGTPAAPTPSTADNSTKLATTAYVQAQGYLTSASLSGLTDAVISSVADRNILMYESSTSKWKNKTLVAGDIPNITESQVTNLTTDLAAKAPLASPTFTGTPLSTTPGTSDNSTKIATTAYVKAQGYLTSPIAESDVTGLVSDLALKAPLASPALTGTPVAPTAAVDTNTTQLATTAFVVAQASAVGDGTPAMDGTAARGSSTHFARADHVHPSDTSRVATTRSISTTAPLTGGGDLSADRTLAISNFTGDSGSGGAKGAVPAPASGDAAAGKFLKADATWAVPSGNVRGDVAVTTGTLANNATETGSFALGKSSEVYKCVVSAKARVRFYETSAARDADLTRAIGANTADNAGLCMETVQNTAGLLSLVLDPVPSVRNMDGSVSTSIYYSITNLSGASAAITATITRLLTEQ